MLAGEIGVKSDQQELADNIQMRAAQVLVYTQATIPGAKLRLGITNTSDASHAAIWYALGRGRIDAQQADIQAIYDSAIKGSTTEQAVVDPWGQILGSLSMRARYECIGLRKWVCTEVPSPPSLSFEAEKCLEQLKVWATARQDKTANGDSFSKDVASVTYPSGVSGSSQIQAAAFDRLATEIRGGKYKTDPAEIMVATCFVQNAMGDPRSIIDGSKNPDAASILDGYRSLRSSIISPALRAGWSKYFLGVAAVAKQKGYIAIEQEAVRTVAFFRPDSLEVLDSLLSRIDEESHPTSDINVLCVIAASQFKPNPEQAKKIASGFAGVSEKVRARSLPTDNRWTTRQQQLMEALTSVDPNFMRLLMEHLQLPGHGLWTGWIGCLCSNSARHLPR